MSFSNLPPLMPEDSNFQFHNASLLQPYSHEAELSDDLWQRSPSPFYPFTPQRPPLPHITTDLQSLSMDRSNFVVGDADQQQLQQSLAPMNDQFPDFTNPTFDFFEPQLYQYDFTDPTSSTSNAFSSPLSSQSMVYGQRISTPSTPGYGPSSGHLGRLSTPSPYSGTMPITPTSTELLGHSPQIIPPQIPNSPGMFSPGLLLVTDPTFKPQVTTANPQYSVPSQTKDTQALRSSSANPNADVFIPQKIYRPHTLSDRRRYVEEVTLEAPIHFQVTNPRQDGISLRDALTSRFMRLVGRDDPMFVNRGPSVSIRLEWEGYQSWSRQIPTRDFRSPPGPITRAKLAKNVAKSIERFIQEHLDVKLEPGCDPRWRVGPGGIELDRLVLSHLTHVSMGSWQAHLKLAPPPPQPRR